MPLTLTKPISKKNRLLGKFRKLWVLKKNVIFLIPKVCQFFPGFHFFWKLLKIGSVSVMGIIKNFLNLQVVGWRPCPSHCSEYQGGLFKYYLVS